MSNRHNIQMAPIALLAAVSLAASTAMVDAQPVFDGTTGGQAPGTVASDTIDVSQGTRAGGNVFHSFSSFSIGAGQTVTFTDNTPTTPVDRIINRVTGTSISEINGTLRSIVPGADFYFINPNGVVMGSGSVVDVPASFYLSTADELRFDNGDVLRANAGDSTFTSAAPRAFGFTRTIPGDIIVTEGQIAGKPGANVGIVAGNVTIQDGEVEGVTSRVLTTGGNIYITAVLGPADVPIDPDDPGASVANFGNIAINGGIPGDESALAFDQTLIASSVVDDPKRGGIWLRGANINIGRAAVSTATTGATRAGDIHITASKDVTVSKYGQIFSSDGISTPFDLRYPGGSGDVSISARNIYVDGGDGSSLSTFIGDPATGRGNVGDAGCAVEAFKCISSSGDLAISATGIFEIRSASLGAWDPANQSRDNSEAAITIAANALDARGVTIRAPFSDLFFDLVTSVAISDSLIRASNISINAGGDVALESSSFAISRIGKGRVTGGNVQLINSDFTNTRSSGCNYCLDTALTDPAFTFSAAASFRMNGGIVDTINNLAGSAYGGVLVHGQSVTIENDALLRTYGGNGPAGDVAIDGDAVTFRNGATVQSEGNEGAPLDSETGDVFINAGTLLFSSAGLSANSLSSSDDDAGDIYINARTVELVDGGYLSAVAGGAGDAGTITVCCAESFGVTGFGAGPLINNYAGSQLVAGTTVGSTGNAGRIVISAKNVTLSDGGRMTVASDGSGLGGEILIRARTFTASDPNRVAEGRSDAEAAGLATLSSAAGTSSAGAGRIMIEAGIFNLFDSAVITTATFGARPAGGISLRASQLNISGEKALISSKAQGTAGGDAGDIDIGTVNFTLSDGASFSTLAQSGGGGNIKFSWNGIGRINNASITTDVLGGAGGGGTITFGGTVEVLDFDTLFKLICGELAESFATYENLTPYNPASTKPPILQLNNATISASAQQGAGGRVVVSPNVVVLSNVDLPSDFDVSSVTGPDGSVIAPVPFVPPPVIIVPERNVTNRCQSGRRPSALADSLSGRAAVGSDPSSLLPEGLPGGPDGVLAAAVERLCAA